MIRITRTEHRSETLVQLAGRLEAKHVAELEAQCSTAGGRLVLDLTELQSADREGIRSLRILADRGATLTGPSPYISLLLDRFRPTQPLPGDTDP